MKKRLWAIPLVPLYALGVWIHRFLTRAKPSSDCAPTAVTIGIGNLHVGGTGKTPTSLFILDLLSSVLGTNTVGYLSRGYGRTTQGFQWVDRVKSTADGVGDEALMVSKKRPQNPVAVCENRTEGLRHMLATYALHAIVLDDVFQHRPLLPTFSLLLCPFDRPWWLDSLLPVGNLRESPRAARRAHCLLVTGTPSHLTMEELHDFSVRLKKSSQTQLPVFFSTWAYDQPYLVGGQGIGYSSTLKETQSNSSLICATGIAHPKGLHDYLKQSGRTVHPVVLSDHAPFDFKTIELVAHLAETHHSRSVIITEKDWARLGRKPARWNAINLYVQPIQLHFLEGPEGGQEVFASYLCSHAGLL